jgi:hypothetical protein
MRSADPLAHEALVQTLIHLDSLDRQLTASDVELVESAADETSASSRIVALRVLPRSLACASTRARRSSGSEIITFAMRRLYPVLLECRSAELSRRTGAREDNALG